MPTEQTINDIYKFRIIIYGLEKTKTQRIASMSAHNHVVLTTFMGPAYCGKAASTPPEFIQQTSI